MMTNSKRNIIKILFLVYLTMVMFLCFYRFSSGGMDLGKTFLGIRLDRYIHFLMFLPYPFACWLLLRNSGHFPKLHRLATILTLASGLLFAALTEIAQNYLIEGRQGDLLDFAADSAAILLGTALIAIIARKLSE